MGNRLPSRRGAGALLLQGGGLSLVVMPSRTRIREPRDGTPDGCLTGMRQDTARSGQRLGKPAEPALVPLTRFPGYIPDIMTFSLDQRPTRSRSAGTAQWK